jgi:hypothetical protein
MFPGTTKNMAYQSRINDNDICITARATPSLFVCSFVHMFICSQLVNKRRV